MTEMKRKRGFLSCLTALLLLSLCLSLAACGGSSGHGFHTRLFVPFAFLIWLNA